MAGETVEMLLAIGKAREALRKGNAAKILGVPVRPGQRACGRREKSLISCCGKHAYFSQVHQSKSGAASLALLS
jgi:hypothetical protein